MDAEGTAVDPIPPVGAQADGNFGIEAAHNASVNFLLVAMFFREIMDSRYNILKPLVGEHLPIADANAPGDAFNGMAGAYLGEDLPSELLTLQEDCDV